MRVAVIHEWLESYSGSERTLEQILEVFPQAELFCLVDWLPSEERAFLKGRTVKTSFIQQLPFAKKRFRRYLPLFPLAIEQFDLSHFDLVISNSHAVAKGVIVGPRQLHISHCCTPIRYAWDLRDQYLTEASYSGIKALVARATLHYLRIWDAATAQSVDHYVAISEFVARRIKKFYGRDSVVIYPPVDVHQFTLQENKEDFYLTASRLVPYKKVHEIVEAFRGLPDKKLVVIGGGPESDKIAKLAKSCANITLMGYQPTSVLRDHMRRAKAFLFAAKEDFGIIVLEAQACGTPVIAFREGGSWETVRGLGVTDKPTGIFFDSQTPDAIIEAVRRFEREGSAIRPAACRANAMEFSQERFREQLTNFVEERFNYHSEQRQTQHFSRPFAPVRG